MPTTPPLTRRTFVAGGSLGVATSGMASTGSARATGPTGPFDTCRAMIEALEGAPALGLEPDPAGGPAGCAGEEAFWMSVTTVTRRREAGQVQPGGQGRHCGRQRRGADGPAAGHGRDPLTLAPGALARVDAKWGELIAGAAGS
jgi:hypothetical protein